MANVKISGLTDGSPAQAADQIPINRSGTNFRINAGGIGMPQFADYTISIVSGTVYARNNTTGVIDYSGADAAVVVNSALGAISTTGGHLLFKDGVYPLSSATLDAASSTYYCIGIPANPSSTSAVEYHFVGESMTISLNAAVSSSGVLFNETAAVRTAAGAGNAISLLWQIQGATPGLGNDVYFENISARIIDNQRGNEIAFGMTYSIYCDFLNCQADTATAANSLLAPVDGAHTQVGFVTNQGGTNECYLRNCNCVGYYTGYRIDSEHSHVINIKSRKCNIPFKYATSGNVYHPGEWRQAQTIQCISDLVIGAAAQKGSVLNITNYDQEITLAGAFAFTNGASETNPGFSTGIIRRSVIQSPIGVINPSPMFTSGGSGFLVIDGGKRVQPSLVTSSSVSAATTGTTKQTLATYTFLDGPQGSDGSIFQNGIGNVVRIKAWGITAANGNSKTVELDFGASAISTITTTASNGVVELLADIIVKATNSQECLGKCTDGTATTLTRTAATITSAAAIVLNLAATTPTSSGDFTFKGWTIEYLAGSR